MNTNMKETEMRELNLNELEQVNGGCIWCIAALGSTAVWIAAIGGLVYLANK